MPNRPYLDASVQWRINSGQLSLEEPDYRSVVDAILSAGVRVPTPARRVENMFSMRYLGTDDGPAPRLKDVLLEEPREFLEDALDMVRRLIGAGVVHGDMSAFNVLVHRGELWLIDFSEAIRVDRAGSSPWVRLTEARTALESGLAALQTYFRRYDLQIDVAACASELVESLDRFGVMH